MTLPLGTFLTQGCIVLVVLCQGASLLAQQGQPATADISEEELRRRAALLASDIGVESLRGDRWVAAEGSPEPLMYFGEPTRNNSNGSVWIWGKSGRPAAVMELYQPSDRPTDWIAVVNNLSGGKARASRGGRNWWRENQSALATGPMPEAPEVADQPRQRLRQMRMMAERFSAHEFWDPNNSRFELRLLPQPIARYSDEGNGLVDGTMFVLANGTNPEVVLLIEARKEGTGKTVWNYGLARMGHAKIHVSIGDKEVWTVARVGDVPSDGSYWLDYRMVPDVEFQALAGGQSGN